VNKHRTPWIIARTVLPLVPAGIIGLIAWVVHEPLSPAAAAYVITFGLLWLVPDPKLGTSAGRTIALVLLVPTVILPIGLGIWVLGLVGKGSQEASCITALMQLQGAKAAWALEHEKASEDLPSWSDLIGPERYLEPMPRCPAGGTYTLGVMRELPRCSIPGHVLELSGSSNQVVSETAKH